MLPPEPSVKPPLSFFKKLAHENTTKLWNHSWNQSQECRQSKFFIHEYDSKRVKSIICLDRKLLSKVIQFITGHGPFGHHLKLTGFQDTNTCRFCGECDEEAWHITGECPALTEYRLKILGSPYLEPPYKIKDLIKLLKGNHRGAPFVEQFSVDLT